MASKQKSKPKPILLITGVTGYVGHHILEHIDKIYDEYTVYATHRNKNPKIKSGKVQYIKLELGNDNSIQSAVDAVFKNNEIPDIIIHCAAATHVGYCQKNEDKAMKINCPTLFIDSLLNKYKKANISKDPLFIFFSTDHVYDGELSHTNTIKHASIRDLFADDINDSDNDNDDEDKKVNDNDNKEVYDEMSPCYPLNNYGTSKLMMEKYLSMHWKNLIILRSSVIYGPKNKKKQTLLQFVVNELNNDKKKEVTLFKNEHRNFVSIQSIIKTVEYFINIYYDNKEKEYHDIYNCGGINSLNRTEFGENIAKIYGLDTKKIKSMNRFDCKQKWAQAAPNPQDVTMSSQKLYKELGQFYKFPPFLENIKRIKSQQPKK